MYGDTAGEANEMAGNGEDDADVNLALAAANNANLDMLADAGAAQAAGFVPQLVPQPQQQALQPPPAPGAQEQVPGEQPIAGQQL